MARLSPKARHAHKWWRSWLHGSGGGGGNGDSGTNARRRRRLVALLLVLLLPAFHFLLSLLVHGTAGYEETQAATAASSHSGFLQALSAWSPSPAGGPPPRQSEVAIVMADTRDVLAVPEYKWYEEGKLDPFWYGVVTAAMNQEYACRHGYDFLFYHIHREAEAVEGKAQAAQAPSTNVNTTDPAPGAVSTSHFLETSPTEEIQSKEGFEKHYQKTEAVDKYQQGCKSPADGGALRSSPWCKVVVLDRVLQLGYKYAVVIDTDALFIDFNLSIPAMLDKYVNSTQRLENGGHAGVFISNDQPFRNERVNTGFMIAQASSEAQRFLRAWWDTPSGEWLTRSPFEQEVLNLEREAGTNPVLLENGARMELSLLFNGPKDGAFTWGWGWERG